MNDRMFSFRLPSDHYEKLRELAKKDERSVAFIVNKLIKELLEKEADEQRV
jgi:predicted DNA-binding protein